MGPRRLGGGVSRSDAQDPGTWATLQAHGVRIDRVRQTVTAALATDEDADLLGVAPGSALLLVRRVAHDASGAPVALADHRYLALAVQPRGGVRRLVRGRRGRAARPARLGGRRAYDASDCS